MSQRAFTYTMPMHPADAAAATAAAASCRSRGTGPAPVLSTLFRSIHASQIHKFKQLKLQREANRNAAAMVPAVGNGVATPAAAASSSRRLTPARMSSLSPAEPGSDDASGDDEGGEPSGSVSISSSFLTLSRSLDASLRALAQRVEVVHSSEAAAAESARVARLASDHVMAQMDSRLLSLQKQLLQQRQEAERRELQLAEAHAAQRELQDRVSELEQQLQSALSDPNSTAARQLHSTLLAMQLPDAEPAAVPGAAAAISQEDEFESKQQQAPSEHEQAEPDHAAEENGEEAREAGNAQGELADAVVVASDSEGKRSSERKRSARRRRRRRAAIQPSGQLQSLTCFCV